MRPCRMGSALQHDHRDRDSSKPEADLPSGMTMIAVHAHGSPQPVK